MTQMARSFMGGTLTTALAVVLLAGCGGEETSTAADEGSSETYTSEVLVTSYNDALDVSSQLALGTIQLEGIELAVTPEQATALLPLWQALQGGVTAEMEVNAILRQIEGTMSDEQLLAIAAMQLTREDLQAWMQEQGMGFARPGEGPEGFPAPEEWQEGTPSPGERPGGFSGPGAGPSGGMGGEVPPEMATRQAEFADMSEEEREALRATMQAGGDLPGGPGGRASTGGGRQFFLLLNPLIELLETRAAQE